MLPFEHAYSHVNAFSSAIQAYLTLGSPKHLRAAKNGFEMLLTTQSFATGGWGPNEAFVEPNRGGIGDSLSLTHASFETPCGAYGHLKIARYLLCATKDSRYGDSMERVLYNTILGAWPVQADGTSFYYSDYATTGKKVWHRDKWPCCSGTFPQLAADYHVSAYLRANDGIYVNLFTPSSIRWSDAGGRHSLRQHTDYPFQSTVRMQVSGGGPAEYAVNVRIPQWASPNPVIAVNGSRVREQVQPGTFVAIRRTWKDGDVIELELPMPLRLEAVDVQHPNLVALLRGPLVLFAISDTQPTFDNAELLHARPSGSQGESLATSADGKAITMRPFMNIQDENYSTYVLLKS